MLNIFKPASGELQKYVEYYYIFTAERPENISYIAFPHIHTGLSFFKDVSVTRGDHEITLEAQQNADGTVHVEILGKYTKPVFVNYRGYFDEVAIIFKPLGINRFISTDLSPLTKDFSQALKLGNWAKFGAILFNETVAESRISLLDEFLLANLSASADERLVKALGLLEDITSDLTIAEIASLAEMNVKTFQRHFLRNIGCTPSEYKRVARFRKSVNTKLLSNQLNSLTQITYAHQYYDQSYFIREFKKLTHFNPGSFFKSITVLDKAGIVWAIR